MCSSGIPKMTKNLKSSGALRFLAVYRMRPEGDDWIGESTLVVTPAWLGDELGLQGWWYLRADVERRLPGVVPGAGTLVVVGTALGDATVCMKFQVDMAMCLAEAYGYDVTDEDAQHLAFLVAAGTSVENLGGKAGAQIASKAGVKMLQQYLKGATLVAVKEFFKRLGLVFTRKALEKMIPFGIGVVFGAVGNYALTKYVGHQAKKWFVIDREM